MMGLVSPCQVIDRLCCRKKWIFNVSWLLIHELDWLKGKENSGTLEKVQWGCWLEKCGNSFFSEQGLLFWETELQVSPSQSAGQAAEPGSPITYSVNDKAGIMLKGSHPHFYQRIPPEAEKLPIPQQLGTCPLGIFVFSSWLLTKPLKNMFLEALFQRWWWGRTGSICTLWIHLRLEKASSQAAQRNFIFLSLWNWRLPILE